MGEVKGKRVKGRVLCATHRIGKDEGSVVTKLITLEGERNGLISVHGKPARVFRKHMDFPDYDWVFGGFVRT